ncbi:conjugal transfer protein TraD [Xanthomonas oryzae]|nr:conjugal transfer protein TraD [Xanthomonas oryzae]
MQLKAQEKLKLQREKKRAAEADKRKKLAEAWQLTREQDAHRKIQLGGVVIAAGADRMDPAELCGILLMALRNLTPDRLPALKEMGLQHFQTRKAAREDK